MAGRMTALIERCAGELAGMPTRKRDERGEKKEKTRKDLGNGKNLGSGQE